MLKHKSRKTTSLQQTVQTTILERTDSTDLLDKMQIATLNTKIANIASKTIAFEGSESKIAASSKGLMFAAQSSQGIPFSEIWALLKDLCNGEMNNILHDVLTNLDTEIKVIDSKDEKGKKLLELKIVSSSDAITKYARLLQIVIGKKKKKELTDTDITNDELQEFKQTLNEFMEKIDKLPAPGASNDDLKNTLEKTKKQINDHPYQLMLIKDAMGDLIDNIQNDNNNGSNGFMTIFACFQTAPGLNQEKKDCFCSCLSNIQTHSKTKEEVAGGLFFILRKAESRCSEREFLYVREKLSQFIRENKLQPATDKDTVRCINTFITGEHLIDCHKSWEKPFQVSAVDYINDIDEEKLNILLVS